MVLHRFLELYVNRIGPESLQGFHVGYRAVSATTTDRTDPKST
jgi:hypothetical protein